MRASRRVLFAFAVACSMTCGGGEASAQDLRPARFCGACHGPIRREWETSAMAKSWKNPVFQAFLTDAKAALGDSVLASCVACHAPAAAVTADYKFESPVSQEGVTCNFCHNVTAVDPSPLPASYTFDASDPLLMRGPYKDSDPGSAHGFVYSEIHTKGEFCAACHEHAAGGTGVPIETTYSRWKKSEAASQGKQCQDCHMTPYAGQAAPKISKKNREKVHAHSFRAAHTPGVLDSVATLKASVEKGRLRLTVRNRRVGHSLPGGGGGMRVIRLTVSFFGAAGESLGTTEVQTYGIRYADAKGVTPVPKWLAHTIAHQAEVAADSAAVEWCEIPVKAKRAQASLVYYFIDPAYLPSLTKRKVDLSAHQPVVMARDATKLP
jgi:hypothetical protein